MIFYQIPSLTEILKEMDRYLPKNFKYVRIYLHTIGHKKYMMELDMFNDSWQKIKKLHVFSKVEREKHDYQICVHDFIYNSLLGMTDFSVMIEYFDFYPEREYFYEYKRN